MNSFEVGYRAQLAKKLYVDVDYFYNIYNNFIATQNFIGNTDGTRPSAGPAWRCRRPGRSRTRP